METIIDRQFLPETILSYIHSDKIRLIKKEGSIMLSPVYDKYAILEKTFGMLPELSVEEFIKQKEIEIELER